MNNSLYHLLYTEYVWSHSTVLVVVCVPTSAKELMQKPTGAYNSNSGAKFKQNYLHGCS